MSHRIEVSPTNRAGCKNTECKKGGFKIQKGQLRFGTFVTAQDWQSWAWKHWGCVTPRQISNLKKDLEGDATQLDGYDELPEEFQQKVVNALEQGHIDDEDWSWDMEMNREGKNGYRTLETKRRLKAEAQALKDEAAGEQSASPSKTDQKKRSHVKDDPEAAENEAEHEPPTKKTKAKMKKEPKIKNEDAADGSGNEGLAIKKSTRTKKQSKVKNEDAEIRSENEGPANKKIKAAIKKEKNASGDEAESDFEQEAPPVKRGRKRAKKATLVDDSALRVKDESSDHETLPPTITKKARAPRKAVKAKKLKGEKTEADGLDQASELETPLAGEEPDQPSGLEAEASEDAPKVKKGRKTASKKAVNGTAEDTKKAVKAKAIPAAPRSNGRVTRSHPDQSSQTNY